MKNSTLAFLLIVLFAGFASAAADKAVKRPAQPIQVKSDELYTDTAKKTATFVGRVAAKQGDITIYADRLVVYSSGKDQDLSSVEAFGTVKVVQGDRLALAGHAVYDTKAGTIVLDQDPKVFQGDDVVSGTVITYHVDDQKSVVSGGGSRRVEAVIHPKESRGGHGAAQP
jgi:lipopolysaccharide export system protein LptA